MAQEKVPSLAELFRDLNENEKKEKMKKKNKNDNEDKKIILIFYISPGNQGLKDAFLDYLNENEIVFETKEKHGKSTYIKAFFPNRDEVGTFLANMTKLEMRVFVHIADLPI